MEFLEKLHDIQWTGITAGTLRVILILLVAWVALRAAKIALHRFEQHMILHGAAAGEVPSESHKRADTLVRLLRQGVLILLWLVTGLVLLRELGVEIGPILASAGIVGLALGFGAQNLVRDVISGFFMILENQVRVGDVAVVNGKSGLVEQINFRTIVLRDDAGTVHVFPNGSITALANMTRDWSAYVFDIGIAYKEDVDRVTRLMGAVAAEMRADRQFSRLISADMEIFGLDKFADSAVMIKARIKTVPGKQWDVGRDYLRRLKQALDREAIEIPFPQRVLHFGETSRPIALQTVAPPTRESQ